MIAFFNDSAVWREHTVRRKDFSPLAQRLCQWSVPSLIKGFEGV